MTAIRSFQRFLTLLTLMGTLVGAFLCFVRPWHRTWGATQAETLRSLPGDEVVPDADTLSSATRAVTIYAPIAAVWPWLAQLGQDRGGFYSYEVLEDIVGCDVDNANRIHPEFQAWKPGDKLWMFPATKLNGLGHAPLARYEEGRVLAFATRRPGSAPPAPPDGSWSFMLEPIDSNATRLLVRSRAAPGRSVAGTVFDQLVFEPIQFVMERKTMLGIKLRAEGGRGSKAEDTVQVSLWTMTFVLFVLAGVLTVRREQWLRPFAAFATAAVVFPILTLLQPPIAAGSALVIALLAVLWLRLPLASNQSLPTSARA